MRGVDSGPLPTMDTSTLSEEDVGKMRVVQLRKALKAAGLDTSGRKNDLVGILWARYLLLAHVPDVAVLHSASRCHG